LEKKEANMLGKDIELIMDESCDIGIVKKKLFNGIPKLSRIRG